MKKKLFIILMFSVFITEAHSRDINLDKIYIKTSSPSYIHLLEKKLGAYEAVGSSFIDRDVVFADWVDGFEIIYVREYPSINIIYIHNRKSSSTREVSRIRGVVTSAKKSAGGGYLFLKTIDMKQDVPEGKTCQVNIRNGRTTYMDSRNPFMDFSISPEGNSIITETRDGLMEIYPESGSKSVIVKKKSYADLSGGDNPVLAYLSPNKKNFFIMSGSGGSYSSKILSETGTINLKGISSSSEIFWLTNTQVIYRRGGIGNYSVRLFDVKSRTEKTILNNSLNTNITYSVHPRIISALRDQVINIYDVRNGKLFNTGIEGEDVYFSPDGSRFVSLYLKKLFISNINNIKSKNLELKKISSQIAELYSGLVRSQESWNNDYSMTYISRKLDLYRKLAGSE